MGDYQVLELKKELACVKTRLSALELLARPWQEICHARPSSFLPFDDIDESEASRGGLGGEGMGDGKGLSGEELVRPVENYEVQLVVQELVQKYFDEPQFPSPKSC